MKLALMALVTEIFLARLFAGSWGLAVMLVAIYCTIVYIIMTRKVWLTKKRNKNKTKTNSQFNIIQGMNRNNSSEKQVYTMY